MYNRVILFSLHVFSDYYCIKPNNYCLIRTFFPNENIPVQLFISDKKTEVCLDVLIMAEFGSVQLLMLQVVQEVHTHLSLRGEPSQ